MNDPAQKKLLDAVTTAVAQDPALSVAILDAVSGGLRAFEAHALAKRNGIARRAVTSLLCGRATYMRDVPWAIDVAFQLFPQGPAGHAPVERKFWADFLDLARRKGVDREWLADVKGRDYAAWWDRVVEPALTPADDPAATPATP